MPILLVFLGCSNDAPCERPLEDYCPDVGWSTCPDLEEWREAWGLSCGEQACAGLTAVWCALDDDVVTGFFDARGVLVGVREESAFPLYCGRKYTVHYGEVPTCTWGR